MICRKEMFLIVLLLLLRGLVAFDEFDVALGHGHGTVGVVVDHVDDVDPHLVLV